MCSTGAAEDGRAPTEELSCVKGWWFCSTGAAEDDRAPTEELPCVRGLGLLFDELTRNIAKFSDSRAAT